MARVNFPVLLVPLLLACRDEATRPVVAVPDGDGGSPPVGESDAAPVPNDCDASIGNQDLDGDHYARSDGDCDDCDPLRGPMSIDVPGNGIDEDCDGQDATSAERCDDKLEPTDLAERALVAALGICRTKAKQSTREWGLKEARWWRLAGAGEDGATLADPRQVWLPEQFGLIPPREGGRMVVLSTGVARDVNDEDAYTPECDALDSVLTASGWSESAAPPPGYPRDSTQCKDRQVSRDARAYNDVGFELELRTPKNATALAFDSMFFTYEYPDYVCSAYNDFFAVFMDPAPRQFDDGNIMLDENEDPIGVNSGLLSVCKVSSRAGRTIDCADGPELLEQTGYGPDESACGAAAGTRADIGGASTGWLTTEVEVQGGRSYTLRFILWDSGDPLLDSTVLIDNLRFVVGPPIPPSQPPTRPITAGE